MKTYKQILDKVYSIPEQESYDDFSEYSAEQKNALLLALDEIWEEHNFAFKERSTSFSTVALTSAYDLPYGKLMDKGLKESTSSSPLEKMNNFDELSTSSGLPTYFSIEANKINLYPTPDDVYTINMKYYTDYKALTGTTEQDTLENEADTLNIPAYIEDHFLTTLTYKVIMNSTVDPTDELYLHAKPNYDRALKLLISKSNRSASSPRFVI